MHYCRVAKLRLIFFATNACNLPKYALEHVWECFWAFGSGTKNDAKRIRFATRMHYWPVAKVGRLVSECTQPTVPSTARNVSGTGLWDLAAGRKIVEKRRVSGR